MKVQISIIEVGMIVLGAFFCGMVLGQPGSFFHKKERKAKQEKKKLLVKGWSIGSPAAGEVEKIIKNGKIELRILPEVGEVYAPGGGKIIKIFPGGSALVLLLDCGAELKIEIGEGTEALEGMYFRTRVLKNEYVNKGKLILEYDVEKLKAAGYDPRIRMQILNSWQEEGGEYVLTKEENGFEEAADSEKNQEIGEMPGRRKKVKVGEEIYETEESTQECTSEL